MTDLQRVSGRGSPFSGRDRAIALVVTIGVLAAIAKPWGPEADLAGTTPRPSASSTPPPPSVQLAGHAFDPDLFGPFEPAPDWSIWPAGYFVSVQYVTRQAIDRPSGAPATGPSQSPQSPQSPSTPSPRPLPSPAGPDWPPEIEVGSGDHLLWLGIDTPIGWTIRETVLSRIALDGSLTNVPITRLPSEWDDHFAVLGIPVDASSQRLTEWPAGTYRLDVTVEPGRITRTIRITIKTATDPVPERGDTTMP